MYENILIKNYLVQNQKVKIISILQKVFYNQTNLIKNIHFSQLQFAGWIHCIIWDNIFVMY